MFSNRQWKEWLKDDNAWDVLLIAKGGLGFGGVVKSSGGVGSGLGVQRLHQIELTRGYLASREVGGLKERFFVTLCT
jgi:hypothetical protein